MEEFLGIAARSFIRHAVIGVLTGGTDNVFMLAGDLMDISDTLDAVDAVDAVASVNTGGQQLQLQPRQPPRCFLRG